MYLYYRGNWDDEQEVILEPSYGKRVRGYTCKVIDFA